MPFRRRAVRLTQRAHPLGERGVGSSQDGLLGSGVQLLLLVGIRLVGEVRNQLAIFNGERLLGGQLESPPFPSAAFTLPCSPSAASASRKCTRIGFLSSSGRKRNA